MAVCRCGKQATILRQGSFRHARQATIPLCDNCDKQFMANMKTFQQTEQFYHGVALKQSRPHWLGTQPKRQSDDEYPPLETVVSELGLV